MANHGRYGESLVLKISSPERTGEFLKRVRKGPRNDSPGGRS